MVRSRISPPIAMALAMIVTACGASVGPAPRPSPEKEPRPALRDAGHVHSMDLNPEDGSVLVATHRGVFRVDRRVATASRVGSAHDVTALAVARDDQRPEGVVRLLASGHGDARGSAPGDLGLVVSDDGAQTWRPVLLSGQADFHALSTAGAEVYGFDSASGRIMRSDDGGQHWEPGARLSATDLDADPAKPLRVLATTPGGIQVSDDGGITFGAELQQPPVPLLLLDHVSYRFGTDRLPAVVGVNTLGQVWSLEESGWRRAGTLPGSPAAFTVVGSDRYLAAVGLDVISSDGAGRSWVPLT